jgi:tRNA pseudouridine55 synthase
VSAPGVVVVDKPRGITSFDVVARVRRALGQKRVGHTGTLDPMATGVLPVCVGEATKLVPFLVAGQKQYEAEALLGVTTDTLDAEGTITGERDAGAVTRDQIEHALAGFRGKVLQVPPMHSALRVGGKRLYELAREGVEVEREAREIEIYDMTLGQVSSEGRTVRVGFTVSCGKGTYVRSIAGDLGERLGVGAHLTALRRTRVGGFTIDQAVALDALTGATPLVGLADALSHLPSLVLDENQVLEVKQGKTRAVAALPAPDSGFLRLLRPDGSLLAVAESHSGKPILCRVFG